MATVGLFGKRKHPEIERVARRLVDLATRAGWDVVAEKTLADGLEGVAVEDEKRVVGRSELVVVLGGDGTMIRVVRLLDDRNVPVFGVNLGFLGYLTEFTVDDVAEQFAGVLEGDYETYGRVRLKADLIRDGKTVASAKVLNDVVVNVAGISRIIEIKTEIDGCEITTYRADGLIVSTPTGSTAYSLSAGGPIVVPGVEATLVTPICPHTLTMRPLVVQAESRIELQVVSVTESVQATFDGQEVAQVLAGDRLKIERARGKVLMVKPPRGYFQILRAKLKWGQH